MRTGENVQGTGTHELPFEDVLDELLLVDTLNEAAHLISMSSIFKMNKLESHT